MPRLNVRGRTVDVASPLLGVDRLPREFSTNDPAKLKDELGRLADAIRGLGAEYAAPQLRPLPIAYASTELALGFLSPIEPGSATVTATLPFTAAAFAGCALAVAKRGTAGTVRVQRRADDQLLLGHGDEFFFDCIEPGLYVFVTDGQRWYREPDWENRIGDVESLLTIGSPRLLGRFDVGTGLVQQVTLDDTLEMTVGGALQRAALTGAITAAAGNNATAFASQASATLLGRARGAGTGAPSALTVAQILAVLGLDVTVAATTYTTATSMTVVNFVSEYADTSGMHSTSSDTNRFNIINGGPYLFLAHSFCEQTTANNVGLQIRDSGGNVLSRAGTTEAAGSDTNTGATVLYATIGTVGQWFELLAEWGTASLTATAFLVAIRLPDGT